jgi:hypothetical protein
MQSRNHGVAFNSSEMTSPEQHTEEGSEQKPRHQLDEIQSRARRLHHQHGATYGGYTLEEWLEAEHELDEENKRPASKNHIH